MFANTGIVCYTNKHNLAELSKKNKWFSSMLSFKNTLLYIAILLVSTPVLTDQVYAEFPNDPNALQWSYATADVYHAWEQATGSSQVIVAIIDNGFDETHPDLAGALWTNKGEISGNELDDDENGYTDDVHGFNFVGNGEETNDEDSENAHSVINHATVVAGIIGAVGNNNQYGVGIAYGVKLMNLQVVDENGVGAPEALVEAIYYAVNNGASVINISMVGHGSAPEVRSAINYAYQKGVLVVGAAGNDMENLNETPMFPICNDMYDPYTQVLGVSAIDATRRLASFSNTGSSCIDLTAPGVDIAGPIRSSLQNTEESYVDGWNGTSFATPFVSAAAALVKSIQPTWHIDQIVRTLKSTVRHTPSPDEASYAEAYGKGLVQVGTAVESAKIGVVLDPKLFVEGEVDTSFTAPRRLFVTSEGRGGFSDVLQGNKIDTRAPVLKDVILMTTFRDTSGEPFYAAVKKNGKAYQLSIYTTTWVEKYHWALSVLPSQIFVADIDGDTGKEVVIASESGTMTVFSLNGRKLGVIQSIEGQTKGFGVVHYNIETKRDEIIYASVVANSNTIFRRITSLGSTPEKLFEVALKSLGSIAYLNSSEDHIVVGSEIGTGSLVTIFSLTGEQKNSFSPYDLSFRGGVSVSSVVYGEEGREHIIVTPKRGVESLRIFDSMGKMVLEKSLDTVLSSDKTVLTSVASF